MRYNSSRMLRASKKSKILMKESTVCDSNRVTNVLGSFRPQKPSSYLEASDLTSVDLNKVKSTFVTKGNKQIKVTGCIKNDSQVGHLEKVRMGYWQHFRHSNRFTVAFFKGSVGCLIHSIFPNFLQTVAQDTIRKGQFIRDSAR